MHKLTLYFLLLICVTAKAQIKDTLFLKRTLVDTPYSFYHAIYIDTRYDFKGARSLTDFSFEKSDSTTYFRDLKRLKPLTRKHKLPGGFPSKWILLYKYKDEYYTYVPSDFGEHYKFFITDSTTIDYTMEGPEPSKIRSIQQLSPNSIEINRDNYWQGRTVKINIINPDKEIAVFTFSPTKFMSTEQKFLMVSARKASEFKTIVNFCATDKVNEFCFDTIDFAKLEK